jgi:hypothetical protein
MMQKSFAAAALMGFLVLGLGEAAATPLAASAGAQPAAAQVDTVQYYGPRGYHGPRRGRCWTERAIRYDRFGRPRQVVVERCRGPRY